MQNHTFQNTNTGVRPSTQTAS